MTKNKKKSYVIDPRKNALTKHLIELIGEPKGGGNGHIYNHLRDKILYFEDQYRIVEIWNFWSNDIPIRRRNVKNFYYWYKEGGVTRKDIITYNLFKKAVKANTENIEPTNHYFCGGNGEALYNKIEEWAGDCGNKMDDMLKDYFEISIQQALKFNPKIIITGKSFLGSFGWNCFIQAIKELGGKSEYLIPTTEEKEKSNIFKNKTDWVNKFRQKYLLSGDIETYDKIGTEIFRNGVDATYQKYSKPKERKLGDD